MNNSKIFRFWLVVQVFTSRDTSIITTTATVVNRRAVNGLKEGSREKECEAVAIKSINHLMKNIRFKIQQWLFTCQKFIHKFSHFLWSQLHSITICIQPAITIRFPFTSLLFERPW